MEAGRGQDDERGGDSGKVGGHLTGGNPMTTTNPNNTPPSHVVASQWLKIHPEVSDAVGDIAARRIGECYGEYRIKLGDGYRDCCTLFALGDLFAVGCYFVRKGQEALGRRLCRTALLAAGFNEHIMDLIDQNINGNEPALAGMLGAHDSVGERLFPGELVSIWKRLGVLEDWLQPDATEKHSGRR